MKINVSYSKLEESIARMGTQPIEFDLATEWPQANFNIDEQLLHGISVDFDRIQMDNGLISTSGRQVLLYIPEQKKLDAVLNDASKGSKFHIAECSKLEEMREKDSLDRYIVTTDLSGDFRVYGAENAKEDAKQHYVRLDVCRHCLTYLNYKDYVNCNKAGRDKIVEEFKLDEFFSLYSSMFEYLPQEQFKHRYEGYPEDWKEVSKQYRKKMGYTCENCGVNLSSNKRLIHAHHNRRIKSRCLPQDLKALCLDCHRKEPFHQHMGIKRSDMDIITTLRHEQGISNPTNWQSLRKWIDPSLFGFAEMCESLGLELPHVQYRVVDPKSGDEHYLDIAWPEKRVAVYIGKALEIDRWRILTFKEAHDRINDEDYFQRFKDYMRK